MTRRLGDSPPAVVHRRSKQERTKALAAVFREAGWRREGADWLLEFADVRWYASLSLIRRDDGDWFNISFAAGYLSSDEWAPLVNQGLGNLPAASRHVYLGEDTEAEDPLVVDARDVLIPLIARLTSAAAVVDAWIDGELGWRTAPMSSRIGNGWRLANRYGFGPQRERAEELIRTTRWSIFDRWELRDEGAPVTGWAIKPVGPDWLIDLIERLTRDPQPKEDDTYWQSRITNRH